VEERVDLGQLDLLLVVDDSASMSDKQEILAFAVPDLVEGLVNPSCVDPTGQKKPVRVRTPECPEGMVREFKPVVDMRIGVISSSLGGHGADTCARRGEDASDDVDDRGHLLPGDGSVATCKDKGFLAWDPTQKLAGKAGEPDADDGEADASEDSGADLNTTALIPTLAEMVKRVGQTGCGFESQLESVYRFLIDPSPYETISAPDGKIAVPEGIDQTVARLNAVDDPLNLRCFDQKRRFGIDFLYPIDRYRRGFSEITIADREGNPVPNPLFFAIDPSDGKALTRSPGMVLVAGIVGVPWQDIARQDANGVPNLLTSRVATGPRPLARRRAPVADRRRAGGQGMFKWAKPMAPEVEERIPARYRRAAAEALPKLLQREPEIATLTLAGAAKTGKQEHRGALAP
jgi:hypothetical protein